MEAAWERGGAALYTQQARVTWVRILKLPT